MSLSSRLDSWCKFGGQYTTYVHVFLKLTKCKYFVVLQITSYEHLDTNNSALNAQNTVG